MNRKRFITLTAVAAAAACLTILPTASDGAVVLRWYVDVKGLEATSWRGIFEPNPPPPVSYLADAHGYFDAQDRDGDGKIVPSEVVAIEPMVGAIYPASADTLVHFSYDPSVGLSYQIDGYRYAIDFGHQAETFSDTSRNVYRWTESTLTTIAPPVPIPEAPGLLMATGGLGVMSLVLTWRGRRHLRHGARSRW